MREIKHRYRLQLNVDNWGNYKKGDIGTFFIPLLDENFGLVRWKIDYQWDILSCDEFTGLKDKNGVDIYEADVVYDNQCGNGTVVFQSGCFFTMYDAETTMEFLGLTTDKFGRLQVKRIVEVIGNIYENAELLK